MSKLNPTKSYHPAGILILGLLIAQVLATIQVYLSNIELHAAVSMINNAGYLAIPNEKVMNSLQRFWPACWGGLFFTCSIGAGISLGSMAAGWIWARLFVRNKFVLFVFLSIWGGLLLISNIHGFALFPSLYFLLIAPTLFSLTAKWVTHSAVQSTRRIKWLHLFPIPLLALLWFTQYDNDMFLDLRDNLLLSNYAGKAFSNFYYSYTLYAAEAFKSLDQKLIRTYRLENIRNPRLGLTLTKRLIAHDYLRLPDTADADLRIVHKDNNLVFMGDNRKILLTKVNPFLSDPKKSLQRFSEERDRHGAFRQFTYLSLLFGFPILIYIVLHFVLYYLAALFASQKNAAVAASMLCFIIGLVVLVYFQSNRSGNIRISNISEALESEKLSTRLAALKKIRQEKLEITDYPSYPLVLKSRHPQERYWLVVTMATSRGQQTYNDLLQFLEDENTNVRSMAFYSLGQRKNRQAIKPIIEKIKVSDDWYAQLYAYKALRSLGWKQKRSR
jgi:hypothetical protein